MAKHLDKFTQPFRDSPIPFALAEILTNGSGEMVDLVCRFLNPAAAALLGLSPEDVQGRRLSQLGPERALEQLAPMQAVAFSGSSASFPYVTAGGQTLTVTCYQVMYGTVACLLDPRSGAGAQSGALPELLPGADLELNREGLRCLACSRQLCQLTQWSRRALLDRGGRAFSALVAPADWPALLQELLDAAREKRGVDHDFRLLRRDGGAVWVNLRAEILSTRQGATVFRGVFLDIWISTASGGRGRTCRRPFPGGRRLCGMRRRCWTGCR
ncbi:PAS domain-containing protein [Dysosmobacter welbionis]|uniref:PAS domain-containing protein n=1 Tax=Dysosmobacter welbionis TaxID=2093857 RepID=UPI0023539272